MKTLSEIQKELKAPKGQMNKFGGYRYRSCEDILEAVKPLLDEMSLEISDSIELIGNRFYVKATAKLRDKSGATIAETSAYAREAETKKGMDESQITGAASSYARKYALNGLFCIDDTKDADTMDNTSSDGKKKQMSSEEMELDIKMKKLDMCTTIDDLQKIWRESPALQTNETFKNKVTELGTKIKGQK